MDINRRYDEAINFHSLLELKGRPESMLPTRQKLLPPAKAGLRDFYGRDPGVARRSGAYPWLLSLTPSASFIRYAAR